MQQALRDPLCDNISYPMSKTVISSRKTLRRSLILLSAGIGALSAAQAAEPSTAQPPVSPVAETPATDTARVEPAATAATSETPSKARKYAFGLAIGGLLGAAASLFGFHSVLRWLGRTAKQAGRTTSRAFRAPAKAARGAVSAAQRSLGKPLQGLGRAAGISVGLLALLAVLDIGWKSSLLIGGGAALSLVAAKTLKQRRRRTPPSAPVASVEVPAPATNVHKMREFGAI